MKNEEKKYIWKSWDNSNVMWDHVDAYLQTDVYVYIQQKIHLNAKNGLILFMYDSEIFSTTHSCKHFIIVYFRWIIKECKMYGFFLLLFSRSNLVKTHLLQFGKKKLNSFWLDKLVWWCFKNSSTTPLKGKLSSWKKVFDGCHTGVFRLSCFIIVISL